MSFKLRFQRTAALALVGLATLALASPLAAKRYAVIFGVNYTGNTAGIPPLELCEKDARLMEETLKKEGRFDDVKVFLGPMVTGANVRGALAQLARKAGRGDTVALYFSGHGTFQRDNRAPNGLRNTLVMYNRPHITDAQLNAWLRPIRSPKTVWIFDACYSGGIARKGRKVRGEGDIPIAANSDGKVIENGDDSMFFQNKAIIGSSDANETSIEIGGSINHGLFTYYFAQGLDPDKGDLNRDKTVTVLEAFEWSARRVAKHARRFNHRQHPQISGNASGISIAGDWRPTPPPPEEETVNPEPQPQPQPAPGTVTEEIVTPQEPEVVEHGDNGRVRIITTILESTVAGPTHTNPNEVLKKNRLPNETRKVKVTFSGKEYETRISWADGRRLRSLTREDLRLGYFSWRGQSYKNKAAVLEVKDVPAGVHEVEIMADGYKVIKERMGVEKGSDNKLFVVASMAGYGTIRGKVFQNNFDTPLSRQPIFMPHIYAPNQIARATSARDGSFWFLNLPPGRRYYVVSPLGNNRALDRKFLTVKSGETTKVDVIVRSKFRYGN